MSPRLRWWLQLPLLTASPDSAAVEPLAPAITLQAHSPGMQTVNGVLYLGGQPWSGQLSERELDQSTSLTPYVEGRRHGLATGWHPNGKLTWQRAFRRGNRQGSASGWWPNGQLQFRRQYRSDVFEGEQWAWYESGAPFEVTTPPWQPKPSG